MKVIPSQVFYVGSYRILTTNSKDAQQSSVVQRDPATFVKYKIIGCHYRPAITRGSLRSPGAHLLYPRSSPTLAAGAGPARAPAPRRSLAAVGGGCSDGTLLFNERFHFPSPFAPPVLVSARVFHYRQGCRTIRSSFLIFNDDDNHWRFANSPFR
ncbi:hypothetical protein EVAR_27200_1 [Eumeta japonica]|uniref:Uncharacterized protein n=1 Tax=Eumeta variegata TaxID=151549 RepID=A0A4C1VYD6_EUMVA|nr:hypothetical protein EVAR_27200_1 [Eumeta japonica]